MLAVLVSYVVCQAAPTSLKVRGVGVGRGEIRTKKARLYDRNIDAKHRHFAPKRAPNMCTRVFFCSFVHLRTSEYASTPNLLTVYGPTSGSDYKQLFLAFKKSYSFLYHSSAYTRHIYNAPSKRAREFCR